MRVVVLEADETLGLGNRPVPLPRDGELLVDLTTTGICGTDLSIYSGKIPVHHPLVMGHEMFGYLRSGERVVVDPVVSCGSCFSCSEGHPNLCPNGALLGRDRDGGFSEAIAVPQTNVHVIPVSIGDDVAPLLQVVAVCVHAQHDAPIQAGRSALVVGLGVTGLLHVQIAKARGAAPVIGVTRRASSRELAESLGADLTIDPRDPDLMSKVATATMGRGADVVIESVGRVETLALGIGLVRAGGHVVLFGTITAETGALPFYSLYLKEITWTNPRASTPDDFSVAIRSVASGQVQLEPLVSHRFPLVQLQQAIETAARTDSLKVLLDHRPAP